MREVEGVAALTAGAAGWSVGSAEQRLAQPQREPLLPHSCRSVEEDALREGSCRDARQEPLTKVLVPEQRDYGHAPIWRQRSAGVLAGARRWFVDCSYAKASLMRVASLHGLPNRVMPAGSTPRV